VTASFGIFANSLTRAVAALRLQRKPVVLGRKEKWRCQIAADVVRRLQSLYAMASISTLVPIMFFACNVEREGLLPGKNSA
jgi:hypothetical protein